MAPAHSICVRILALLVSVFHLNACASKNYDPFTSRISEDSFRDSLLGPLMVWLPPGVFYMGDIQREGEPDELPVHKVQINSFAIGKYEVTVAEFRRFISASGYQTEGEKSWGCNILGGKSWREPGFSQEEDFPVVCVTWNDANAYTAWLSEQTGKNYRLPTEAEWEYAARAKSVTSFWWGEELHKDMLHCWECNTYRRDLRTLRVGSFPPNSFGLHDTAGNVWEWTASDYSAPYDGAEMRSSSAGPITGARALRGGSWYNTQMDQRSANRGHLPPDDRYITLGFRVARSAE